MKASVAVALGVALLPVISQSLEANPSGGVVVSGAASINPGANALTITQTSATAIINWNNFSIGQGQSTIFQFNGAAGAHSSVLNEVSSGNPSIISGLLESTVGPGGPIGGTVMVLNPSGILFTSAAQINVGNLLASTLNLADDNQFLKNATLHLAGDSTATVQNEGNLNALGNIYLIANTVQNSGAITAGGHVGLAAGTEVTLMQTGAERLTVTAGSAAPVGVENTATGQINATVAELTAAGGNIYALAINNGGTVRANTITREGGAIYLRGNGGAVVNSGTLAASGTATGAKGGLVEVTGGNITLASGSTVDVSGQSGGGTAYIGGGSHGSDPSIPDAQQTTVESGATINANGVADGNGGKVVVWSSDTSFNGSISAQGGASGGNGGSVEVSGHMLAFNGTVNTLAPEGKGGDLLLDPDDVTIDNGSDVNNSGQGSTITPTSTPSEILWDTITQSLNANGSVTINTVGVNPGDGGFGAITIDASPSGATLALNAGSSLTLQAQNSISVNSPIGAFPGGNYLNNLTLDAMGSIFVNANIQTASSVSMHAGYVANALTGVPFNSSSGGTPFGGGQGTITWNSAGLSVIAPSQSYQAGSGLAYFGLSSALVDLTGTQTTAANAVNGTFTTDYAPTFQSTSAGTTPLTAFTYEQNAPINGTLPAIGAFSGGLANTAYTIQSDNGGVTLPPGSGANLTGALLTLNAYGSIAIDDSLTQASLTANSGIVNPYVSPTSQPAANISWGASSLSVTAPLQIYQAGSSSAIGSGDTVVFNGNGASTFSPSLDGTLTAPPTTFSVTQDATISDGAGGNLPLPAQFANGLPQNYTAVSTGGSVMLSSAGSISGAGTSGLTLGAGPSGLVSVSGTLQATTLTLQGSGNVGTSLNNLTTSAGAVTLGESQPSTDSTYITDTSSTVGVSGTTGGGILNLTAGATTLNGNLTAGSGSTLNTTTLTLGANNISVGASGTLTLINSGAVTTTGGTVTAGTLNLNGGGNVGVAPVGGSPAAPLNTSATTIILAEGQPSGGYNYISDSASSAVDVSGTTGSGSLNLTAGSITVPGSGLSTGSTAATAANLTLTSQGSGSSISINGTVVAQSANLSAVNGINVSSSLTTDGTAVLNADSGNTGAGDLTLNAAVVTGNNPLSISAGNITFNPGGLLNSGSGGTTLNVTGGNTIGLGADSGSLTLNNTVLANDILGSGGLTLTTTGNGGNVSVGGATYLAGPLIITAGGTVSFNAASSAFNSLDVTQAAGVTLSENVTTIADQSYTPTITLAAPTVTLQSGTLELGGVAMAGSTLILDNGSTAQLNGLVNGGGTLTASGAGALVVNNNITVGKVSDSEGTTFNGTGGSETVTTTGGDQNYTGAVTLGTGTTLNTATVELTGVTGNAFGLTLGNTGAATLNGLVSGSGTLTANGSGGSLTVKNNINMGSVSDSEGTTFNGTGGSETITTTGGDQNYTGAVILGTPTTLTSGTVELAGVTGSTFNLTLANTGAATLNGLVSGTGTLMANGSGGSLAVKNNINMGSVSDSEGTTFNGTGGSETITTTGGDQNYTGTVTLGTPTTLSTATVELAGVTGSTFNLTLGNTGAATLNGSVSGTGTLMANGSGGSLAVKNNINMGSVSDSEGTIFNGTGGSETVATTGGDQNYTGTVTLGTPTTLSTATVELAGVTGSTFNLTLGNTGAAALNGAVSGTGTLMANGSGGSLTVKNNINMGSVSDSEGTTLNGTGGSQTITTTGGDQSYTGAVTLGTGTTLTSGTVELAGGVAGGGNSLMVKNSGLATLTSVSGVSTLSVTGASQLSGTLSTSSGQSYAGAVALGGATTLAGTTVSAPGGVTGGGNNLNINNSGTATLGSVGGVGTLSISGASALNGGSVSSTGGQTYSGNVTLGTATTLSGTTVSIPGGVTGAGNSLNIQNSGMATLTSVSGVSSLSVSGASQLGGSVSTSGSQNYAGDVTLGSGTTLTGTTVSAPGITGGGNSLAVANSGTATFGTINGVSALSINGPSQLNGSVTTTGGQTYSGAVTLGAATTLTGTTVALPSVNGGGNDLTVADSGTVTVSGSLSGLKSLSISGASQLNGGAISTTGAQSYSGAVTLGANTTISGTAFTLSGVNLGSDNLTLNNSGLATISGTVLGAGNLTADGTGKLKLDGSSLTTGTLQDSEPTTLAANVTLNAGNNNVTFNSTVDGPDSLTVNAPGGTITLNRPVGNSTPLSSINLDGASLEIDGGSITTTGSQTYIGPLNASTKLTLISQDNSSIGYTLAPGDQNAVTIGQSADPNSVATTTSEIFGALQKKERQHSPKITNPRPSPAPPFPVLVDIASSYPPVSRSYPELLQENR